MPQQKVTKASDTPNWYQITRAPELFDIGEWEFVPDANLHKGGLMFAARRTGTLGNSNPADFYPAVIRMTHCARYGFRCRLTDRGWYWHGLNIPQISRLTLQARLAAWATGRLNSSPLNPPLSVL